MAANSTCSPSAGCIPRKFKPARHRAAWGISLVSSLLPRACGLVAVGLLAVQPAAAQEPAVRIDLMPITLSGKIDTYFVTKGEVKLLEAYSSAMAPPIFYKGPAKLRLYASEADARASLVPPPPTGGPVPVATVTLPTGMRRTLLFQIRGDNQKIEVRAIGVDDKALRAGDLRVFNLSTLNMLAILGKKSFRLAPGASEDVSSSSLGSTDSDLTVQFGYQAGNRQELVYSSLWSHSSAARNYVFLVGTGKPKNPIVVKKFYDVPSVESIGYEKENP